MYCIAYPLRRKGQKLPREEVRSGGRRGWFTFTRMPAGQRVWIARLTGERGGNALPELTSASIVTVERGGLLVRGFELEIGNSMPQPQAWWCVAETVGSTGAPPAPPITGRR